MKSVRLETVSQYFQEGDRVADIGCDHGFLGVYALKRNVSLLQLVDNKKGPLESAINNLTNENNQQTKLIFTLANGLNELDSRINKIALCGMGGLLIIDLISEKLDLSKQFDLIILQANSKIKELRKFLNSNYFEIISENIVYEKGIFYEIIATKYNPMTPVLTDEDCYFGPILRRQKINLFYKKHQLRLKSLEKLLINQQLDVEKKEKITNEIHLIRKELTDES